MPRGFLWSLGLSKRTELQGISGNVNCRPFGFAQDNEQHHHHNGMLHF